MLNNSKIIIASTNQGKVKEIKDFLNLGEQIVDLSFIENLKNEKAPEVDENALTYIDNALLKAKAIFNWSGGSNTILSDDSGLEVEALNGAPGIHSARYAGANLPFQANIDKLFYELQGKENRKAKMVSNIIFLKTLNEHKVFTGEIYGTIIDDPMGNGGFGFDPIFFIDEVGKTLSEIKEQRIPFLTHRQRALQAMLNQISFK